MLSLKTLIPISVISLTCIGLITYFTANQIEATRKMNKSANSFSSYSEIEEENEFIDLDDEKSLAKFMAKLRHYESIERNPVEHLGSFDKEEEKRKLRNLAEANEFDKVVLFDPVTESTYQIGTYIAKYVRQFEPTIIAYPYAFDYKYEENNTMVTKHFSQGSYIGLNQDTLDGFTIGLKANSTVSIKKARAIYDSDIAILSIEATIDGRLQDLFQDAVDWCSYFKDSLEKGSCVATYNDFTTLKAKNVSKTYTTKINETAVNNGALMAQDGLPRFGVLIIPDYRLGVDQLIKQKLGTTGQNKLKEYYQKGGVIIVTGKSGTILEDFKMIGATYDRSKLFSAENSWRNIRTNSCRELINKTYTKDDEIENIRQHLCIGMINSRELALSTSFRIVKQDSSLKTILEIDPSYGNLVLTDIKTGIPEKLADDQKKNPLILYQTNNNGKIFIMNFNPVHRSCSRLPNHNILSYALSKELYMYTKVNMAISTKKIQDVPIPAGESGVSLQIKTIFQNLNDEAINNFNMYLFLTDNFGWSTLPKECEKRNDFASIPKNVTSRKEIESGNDYLLCKSSSIAAYEKLIFDLSIIVENYKATQQKTNIRVMQPIVMYKSPEGKISVISHDVKVNSEVAPVLRVAINPDPNSFYPLLGEGMYVDNSVKIENKEQSGAYDVEYVGIIPIISPLTDSVDQSVLQTALKIYVDYYNKLHNYYLPFSDDMSEEDVIYPSELNDKRVTLVAEWDSPVLPAKIIVSEGNIGQEIHINGMNIGLLSVNSTSEAIKQINYRHSDRFYKLASQRLLVFVDITTKEGAKAYFGDTIPDEWKDPVYKDRAKREFLFVRSDIYFYENENYCNPPNVTEKHLFSIDQFESYKKFKDGCVEQRGQAKSKIYHQGYFSNREEDKKKTILDPNTYTNEMYEYCNLTVLDPLSADSIKKEFGNTDYMRPVHYIVHNVEKTITQPLQIYGFVQDGDTYSGHLNNYPSIKFLYLHSVNYIIPTAKCKYGGRIDINLGDYSITSADDVTVAPDQIAVYKTTYSNKIISIFFKRGLMSNEQNGKDMSLAINIEGLNSRQSIDFQITLAEMKFDISNPPDYETYTNIATKTYTFNYISAFSYPALEIKTKLNRTLNGYETMESFSRYGVYLQEVNHRTIYCYVQSNHQSQPGVVGNGVGFSMISNLGISSIPFLEYVAAGGQLIPAGPSTSRAIWRDIWGRTWQQPIRTVYPDIPPLPIVLKNFMMTTTFEVLRNGVITTEWPSDENVQIHLHIKLLSNYQKYFEITRCKANEIQFVPKELKELHEREFFPTCDATLQKDEYNGNKMLLRQGGFASYGSCFSADGSIVAGQKVEGELKEKILKAKLCADYTDADKVAECDEELANIPGLHKAPSSWDSKEYWNYSPLVDSYYPKGYIWADMWDLTHIYYEDTKMDKAFKIHYDNILPNYDNTCEKPQNAISIPIYKGLGYNITYSKNNKMNYHGKTKYGWWGDNLQNKDDTLLAGNAQSNNISVNKDSLITNWVKGEELVGSKRAGSEEEVKKIVEDRNKNIYVCLFNRKRPFINADTSIRYYTPNVVENNIVPIIVNLTSNDERLYKYKCGDEVYTPDNLQNMEGNYLETQTSNDYLYFGANLRGQAKESFNVLMSLNYFQRTKYEGIVKVNEGGRFVYWNPANGPNSFLMVDNPVSIINAKRNDIEIKNEVFPLRVTTFNSVVYHLYKFYDENKIKREWPFSDYYANSYGFGDVAVSVYVGGIRKSKALVQPNTSTYAKIIFMNNCGFDWNMKGGAIDFKYVDSKPINADDLLYDFVHTIQAPIKYNFLNIEVDKTYAPYVKVGPSDHNIEVAPELFDFDNINVVTIRDGFKGEYNLRINITSDFPDNLRGRPIEIKISLNTSYFDQFPGTSTDPIKSYHNYEVKVPSVYIAVPFKTGEFAGKVLYTSAQGSNLNLHFDIGVDWNIEGIKYIDELTIQKFRNISSSEDFVKLAGEIWNNTKSENIEFTEKTNSDKQTKLVNLVGINKTYPLFPKINQPGPDTAEVYVLVKSFVGQIRSGYSYPITNVKMEYKDWINKSKAYNGDKPQIYGVGPYLVLSYSRTLVDYLGNGKYVESANQQLTPLDSGTMRVYFKLENIGNGNTYNTKYQIIIQPGLTFVDYKAGTNKIKSEKNKSGQTILTFDYGTPINAGESKGGYIYLNFSSLVKSYDDLTTEDIMKLPDELKVTESSQAIIDLTINTGENQVTEYLRTPLSFAYSKSKLTSVFIELKVTGRRSNPTNEITPIINHVGNETDKDVVVSVSKLDLTNYPDENSTNLRLLAEASQPDLNYTKISVNKSVGTVEDKPITKYMSREDHVVLYTVTVYNPKTKIMTSNKIKYVQEDIGISSIEVWFIIFIIIFFGLSVFLIWLSFKNLSASKSNGFFEKFIKNTHLEKLLG